MSINNEIQVESEFNKLNISDEVSVTTNHENCYKSDDPPYKVWCKECVPRCLVEGWTSENHDIDEFIKDTIYNAKYSTLYSCLLFLEWVPFDRFEDIKQIGEGGFAKVYSATWIDGSAKYDKHDDGCWKKRESEPIKVALKRLNGSQNMSAEYLNEVCFTHIFSFYDKLI